jgi:two-component system sensor histidine kinase HydH
MRTDPEAPHQAGPLSEILWPAAAVPSGKAVRVRIALIAGFAIGVSALHYFTPAELVHWHLLYERLFYLPVVYSALLYGWQGGLLGAALASLCYFPHATAARSGLPGLGFDRYLEMGLFFAAGLVIGVLADRERRHRWASEETAEQLKRVYAELQNNFERMKRAERLYAIGQLSAGLAHEIRNPLASIAGAAGILLRSPNRDPAQTEVVEIIDRESRRLNRLLTNFLNFAKPPAPQYRVISLEPVLDSVIGLASHADTLGPVTFRKKISGKKGTVECDPEQLKQVLLNLVINAVQAMPEGGEILLAARIEGARAVLEVSDQGSGVSPEEMDKIFDPFYTTKENGTGLGLSVAHQIVLQLGGMLTARRNAGRGMTFTVIIPVQAEKVL